MLDTPNCASAPNRFFCRRANNEVGKLTLSVPHCSKVHDIRSGRNSIGINRSAALSIPAANSGEIVPPCLLDFNRLDGSLRPHAVVSDLLNRVNCGIPVPLPVGMWILVPIDCAPDLDAVAVEGQIKQEVRLSFAAVLLICPACYEVGSDVTIRREKDFGRLNRMFEP